MKKLITLLLVITIPTICYAGGFTQSMTKIATQKAVKKYEDNQKKQQKYYGKEYQKQKCNPNYKPKSWKEFQREKKDEENKKRKEYRKNIGYWRWIGSKLFGEWVLFIPKKEITDKNKEAKTIIDYKENADYQLFFEDIMDATDEEINEIFEQMGSYIQDIISENKLKINNSNSKREALLLYTKDDYERRTENWIQKVWRDITISIKQSNNIMNNDKPIAPINPINIAK